MNEIDSHQAENININPVKLRSPWIRYRWRIIISVIIVILTYFLYMPTHTIQLPNGLRLNALQSDINTLIQIDPKSGQKKTEQRLLVKYYSDVKGMEQMQAEARNLVSSFFADADRNKLTVIVLKPTQPVLTRSFPLAVKSYYVRFVKDDTGEWKEKSY